MITRREFLDAAAEVQRVSPCFERKELWADHGANDRLNFAVIGLNGRGYAHLSSLQANKCNARISYVCDVDSEYLKNLPADTQSEMGEAPKRRRTFATCWRERMDAITHRDTRPLAYTHGHRRA